MKALLVEQSKTMRSIQKSVLTQLGYDEVQEAMDGEEALRALQSFTPDLVLVAWNMPNMNGVTFVKEFRKRNRAVPIIMVTSESERNRVVEAIKAGVNDYIVKPFTPDILSQRITEVAPKAKVA